MDDAEKQEFTFRERVVLRVLLLVASIACGKSFKGGLDSEHKDSIDDLRTTLNSINTD